MDLKITKLVSEGLRCPDIEIGLEENDFSPITLIQMPNGTGKTTMLDMIQAALTGEAEKWGEDKVRQYRSRTGDKSEGKFVVELLVDNERHTFEVTLHFSEGKASYRTSSPRHGGIEKRWRPDGNIRRFLKSEFIRLFVFDGEFASKLLSPKEAEAEQAIDALCQLDLFDDCMTKARESWKNSTKGEARTSQALTQAINKEKKLREEIDGLEQRCKQAKGELEDIELKISNIDREIGEAIRMVKNAEDELRRLTEEEKEARENVMRISEDIMRIIRKPDKVSKFFIGGLKELKTQLDHARLPPSTSKQFFTELSQEENCICGRPLDSSAREVIRKRARSYLGEEISGVLNTLKEDIDHVSRREPKNSEDLQNGISNLRGAVNARDEVSTKRRRLEEETLQRTGSEEVLQKRNSLEELKQKKSMLDELIQSIEAPDGDFSLAYLKQEHKKAKRRVGEISDTVKLGKQTDIFEEICDSAKRHARESIKIDLIENCNNYLERVLSKVPLRVVGIGRSLKLEGQRGASVGQTLAVGYTFLTSLLHRGQHKFPLIVDSPANPIDISVRREIGLMIPALCKQFLAFTISSEREGFVPALHEASDGKVRYLTLFRRTEGTKNLERNLPSEGVTETGNGLLIEGKEYFWRFDLKQEFEDQ